MEPNFETGPEAGKPNDGERPRFRFSHRTREPQPQPQQEPRHGSNRETIESVVIAFVLAFLFRTFEAEAFVIPTGSMAPTLMGRHKEVACKECGWVFSVGATEVRVECRSCNNDYTASDQGALQCPSCRSRLHQSVDLKHQPPEQGVCPNCRFVNDIEDQPAFKGDRILVLKSLYDLPGWAPGWLREPKRWDVVVFKFPEEPQINYIKRLVGLPNEELRIHYGNIYTRTDPAAEFRIARKPAEKQRVMRMLVYDNNHQSPAWREHGWPSRWQSEPGEPWKESHDGHTFESPAGLSESSEWARLAYHHCVRTWGEKVSTTAPPREQLITDFYAYNAGLPNSNSRDGDQHWVGDLELCVRADVTAAKGKLRLELVEAADRFVCEFDLTAGTCRLLKNTPGDIADEVLATSRHGIVRPGGYSICFGNTDDRLTVWLDDKLLFGDGFDYEGARLEDRRKPTPADLRPASVAVQGTHVRVSDLVLYRDIYYTYGAGGVGGYEYESNPSNWDDTLGDPNQWDVIATARTSSFKKLSPDEFMMMGDNSPRSKDGRLWDEGARRWVRDLANERGSYLDYDKVFEEIAAKPGGEVVRSPMHVVNRQLLIGRAFYVYWPHGVPFGPDWLQFDTPKLGPLGSFRLPFYPNISRMKMIE
jgi:signal peptidase I